MLHKNPGTGAAKFKTPRLFNVNLKIHQYANKEFSIHRTFFSDYQYYQ